MDWPDLPPGLPTYLPMYLCQKVEVLNARRALGCSGPLAPWRFDRWQRRMRTADRPEQTTTLTPPGKCRRRSMSDIWSA